MGQSHWCRQSHRETAVGGGGGCGGGGVCVCVCVWGGGGGGEGERVEIKETFKEQTIKLQTNFLLRCKVSVCIHTV